jgi:hypothetical protein
MADEKKEARSAYLSAPEEIVWAGSANIPVILADFVGGSSLGSGGVRFNLLRADEDAFGRPGNAKLFPVAQIALSKVGFAHLVVNLDRQLASMAESSESYAELVRKLREQAADQTDEEDVTEKVLSEKSTPKVETDA